jgi:4-hydroxybenzoyl-CoA reductase subunit beta
MLTLPPFQYHSPKSVDEAVGLLSQFGTEAKVIAGGTDLIPNMKHRLFTPSHVIGLQAIEGLCGIAERDGIIRIGAMTSIATLAKDGLIARKLPSLAKAAGQIAGPQLREMGTLGGNICLDTRCVYYNQTYFWRQALGFCLKKDGTVCHVVKAGRRCVAAASNDTAPVLMTVGATIRLVGPSGQRQIPICDFYVSDGIKNTVIEPNELLVDVAIPIPAPSTLLRYEKLRVRAAIDYPALTVAIAANLVERRRVEWIRMVVSALGARPHLVKQLESFQGREMNLPLAGEIAQVAYKQCHPLTNINVEPVWRRKMLQVMIRRALIG